MKAKSKLEKKSGKIRSAGPQMLPSLPDEHALSEWLRSGLAGAARAGGDLGGLFSFEEFQIDPQLGVVGTLHAAYDASPQHIQSMFRRSLFLALENVAAADPPSVRRSIINLSKRYRPAGARDHLEGFWRRHAVARLPVEERAPLVSAIVDYLCTYEGSERLLSFLEDLRASTDWSPVFAPVHLVYALPAAGPAWPDKLNALKPDFYSLMDASPYFDLTARLRDFCRRTPAADLRSGIERAVLSRDQWFLDLLFRGADPPLQFTQEAFGEGVAGIDVLKIRCIADEPVVSMQADSEGEFRSEAEWKAHLTASWRQIWNRYRAETPKSLPIEVFPGEVSDADGVVLGGEARREASVMGSNVEIFQSLKNRKQE